MVRRSARLAALRARRARERERRRHGHDRGGSERHDRDKEREADPGRRAPKRTADQIETERKRRKELEDEELQNQKQKESAFKVEKVDFHEEENEKAHHTYAYEKDELVVRRGQVFSLSVVLSSESPFDPKKDLITLHFEIGDNPTESTGTRINVNNVSSLKGVKGWAAQIMSVRKDVVEFHVMTSPAAIVGKYKLTVKTVNNDIDVKWVYHESQPIFVLFNAWCEDDAVYMPNEMERNEYVLNKNGMIWQHSYWRKKGKQWYFGQFEEVALDCALHLLFDLSDVKLYKLGNPVVVSRALSALINSMDDDGVLEGNWSGDYSDGSNPSSWVGSVNILKEFMASGESVKYGQCWVFSGVFTTLGRCLGIPTRSVTNFDSAHDTDGSVTIDKFYEAETYNYIDDKCEDSVWNFHVWNDCWFRRPDLPQGYDGWQAVDSTPQEASSDVFMKDTMCCGPAPLKAIKEGHLAYGSDTPFIFAEVNGDVVYWEVSKDGTETPTHVNSRKIGRCIVTKRICEEESEDEPYGEDIQSQYKYEPGEKEEEVLKRAVSFGSKCTFLGELYGVKNKDVTFDCVMPEDCAIGDDLVFKLNMKNSSSASVTVSVKLQVRAAFYTGVVNPKPCKVETTKVKVSGGSEKDVTIHLTAEDYIDFMVDSKCIFKAYFNAHVEETKQNFFNDEDFVFDKLPELTLECPKKVSEKKSFKVKLSFKNPLARPLAGGVVKIEGNKIDNVSVKQKNIPPYGEFHSEVTVHPVSTRRHYSRTLVHASYTSTQLSITDSQWISISK